MNEDRPRPKWRRDITFMLCLITVLALTVLSCLGFAIMLDRWDSHNTIRRLRTAQAQSAEVTDCVRRLDSVKTDADSDWQHLFTTFLITPPTDREQAKADLAAVDARQQAAAAAVRAFATNPISPCPIAG